MTPMAAPPSLLPDREAHGPETRLLRQSLRRRPSPGWWRSPYSDVRIGTGSAASIADEEAAGLRPDRTTPWTDYEIHHLAPTASGKSGRDR